MRSPMNIILAAAGVALTLLTLATPGLALAGEAMLTVPGLKQDVEVLRWQPGEGSMVLKLAGDEAEPVLRRALENKQRLEQITLRLAEPVKGDGPYTMVLRDVLVTWLEVDRGDPPLKPKPPVTELGLRYGGVGYERQPVPEPSPKQQQPGPTDGQAEVVNP